MLARALEAQGATVSNSAQQLASEALGRPFSANSLTCVKSGVSITAEELRQSLASTRLGSYEIPIDYAADLSSGGRHLIANVGWIKPVPVVVALRLELVNALTAAGISSDGAQGILEKIQTKAYLTDKQTMGPHYSNRDYRWATWPTSIQYASHRDCKQIELELLSELFEFDGAPALSTELRERVTIARGKAWNPSAARCPISGDILRFSDFVAAVQTAAGGKSAFHVGHMQPLTRGGKHVASNVSWVSEAGNRIQGNETLVEIESRLLRAVTYRLDRDLVEGRQVNAADLLPLWALLNEVRRRLGKTPVEW